MSWSLRSTPPELAAWYRGQGWWTDETLGGVLAERLGAHGELTFRIWSEQAPFQGTFADVADLAGRVAGGLAARGVTADDVVAFQLPNRVEAAAAFWGVSLLGAALVPIVHFYGPKEVGWILRQSGARALITADRWGPLDYLANLEALTPDLPDLETVVVVGADAGRHLSFDALVEGVPVTTPAAVDPDAPALVAYTSGTTADPKGVVHTHRSIVAEMRQLGAIQPGPETPSWHRRPMLVGAPVGHAIGMLAGLLLPIWRGESIHLTDTWNPPSVLAAMLEADLTAGSGATFFLLSLLDDPSFTDAHLERMSHIGLGGAPVPAAVSDRAEAQGISIVRSFGSTEHPSTTGATHAEPAAKRKYTDGKALPGVELRLLDEAGGEVGTGVPGEIYSRGPDLFAGYTDPALTVEAIDDEGWYASGDIGVLDEDGWLTITDRKKDIIIRGGENVSAAEVEEALVRLPGVAEVAVVAAPDARLGEHGCAFIRTLPGTEAPSLDDVRRHLEAAGMARQKWPEELRPVDDLPRTPSGKVKKFELRARLRAGRKTG